MSLDIGGIFTSSFKESLTQKGLIAASVYAVLQIANFVFTQSLMPSSLSQYNFISNTLLAGGLEIVTIAMLTVLNIGLFRAFVKNKEISKELFTEDIISASLNTIVGGILFAILVTAGFILLLVPGLFLLTSLFFWTIYVAVEGENFIDAMKSSWNLTKGKRIDLFLLGLAFTFTIGVISTLISIVANLALGLTLGTIVYYGFFGYFTVVNLIGASKAYNTLKE